MPQLIRVTRQPGTVHGGILTIDGRSIPCRLGRSGITHLKREGDGATPAGRMALLGLRYRADRRARPAVAIPLARIRPDHGWCDDVASGRYNRPVRLPFAGSHEQLFRADAVYDLIGILDWNLRSRSIGRGSAIFLHFARETGSPTEGCIALLPRYMRELLCRLRPGAVFLVP